MACIPYSKVSCLRMIGESSLDFSSTKGGGNLSILCVFIACGVVLGV